MRWLNRSALLAAAMAVATACTSPGGKSASSGSLALSTDDSYLYAVDTDNGIMAVIDTSNDTQIATVNVGKNPVRVVVGADDTIYVSNRGERSVSVIHKGEWVEAARIATNVEPNGMAVSDDGRTLYVVSATSLDDPTVGTLTAVDTRSLQPKWESRVGNEPRAVALIAKDRALVTQYKTGELTEVNLKNGEIINGGNSGIYATANKSRLEGTAATYGSAPSTFHPRAMSDIAATPDGERVFVPAVWAREDAIGRRPSVTQPYYESGGPCRVGSVASAGIVTVDTGSDPSPQVDDLTACSLGTVNSSTANYPASQLTPGGVNAQQQMQGPTVAVVEPTGQFLYVVNKESSNVAVMRTYSRGAIGNEDVQFGVTGSSVRSTTRVDEGTDGIALTRDGKKAYTYSQFSHSVQSLYSADPATLKPSNADNAVLATSQSRIVVAQDTLTPDQVVGRKLFFSASDAAISSTATSVACSTCHLEGREDGHVWSFPDGRRQTPSLAGRGLSKTAPFHWSGEFSSIDAFMTHTVRERMGGSGLSNKEIGQMVAWLDSELLPENALAQDEKTASQQHGSEVFQRAQCGTCHSGEFLTDNTFADVGTTRVGVIDADQLPDMKRGFNVPSLRGIARTAPYLHDGSAASLRARIDQNPGDRHGVTSNLTEQDKADLVEYLKTL